MQIYLLLTERCNLHCTMCIRGKQTGNDLNYDRLKTLDFINHIYTDTIVLTGGEPTLYNHLVELTHFLSKRAKSIIITTNGTVEFDVKTIADIRNLQLQVSIDGDKNSHDAIRGAGMFNASFNFLQKLEQAGIRYSVATVVSRKNKDSLEGLIEKLFELKKMSYWKVSYEMPFKNKNYDGMLSALEWNNMVDHLISITPFRLKIKKLFPFELYASNECKLRTISDRRCQNCGGGKDKIYIYPDFSVYPCTCLTDFPLGNLVEASLSEIISSEKASAFRNYEIQEDTVCYRCKYKIYCNGGCIGMSYHYFGMLGKGDIRCPMLSQM